MITITYDHEPTHPSIPFIAVSVANSSLVYLIYELMNFGSSECEAKCVNLTTGIFRVIPIGELRPLSIGTTIKLTQG